MAFGLAFAVAGLCGLEFAAVAGGDNDAASMAQHERPVFGGPCASDPILCPIHCPLQRGRSECLKLKLPLALLPWSARAFAQPEPGRLPRSVVPPVRAAIARTTDRARAPPA